ncbi:MAG: UDP-N-acetylmuramoyl-tripeptide--D-alanyl-D-alanine ligase [Planctomycetota bacterium]
MLELPLFAIARHCAGKIVAGAPELRVNGVSTDTRTLRGGNLFVALNGERFRGLEFAPAAFAAGAAAAVVEGATEAVRVLARGLPVDFGLIHVADARRALGNLARWHRLRFPALCVGVTGSVGKSTTKEMIAHILQTRMRIHATRGNLNNEVGLPLTLLTADSLHEAIVVEMGMNAPGEIARLAALAIPHIAVITCAAAVHLERMGTLEAIAAEKGAILDHQANRPVAVLNRDDPFFDDWRARAKGRVISFGTAPGSDVRISGLDDPAAADLRLSQRTRQAGRMGTWLRLGGLDPIRLPVPGRHNAFNAAAAAAAAVAAGIPLSEAARALESFRNLQSRLQSLPLPGGGFVIDDAYNASPVSFAAALDTFRSLCPLGAPRRIVVAGDMLELGPGAEQFHFDLGRQIAAIDPDALLCVGTLAPVALAGARAHGWQPRGTLSACLPDVDAAAAHVAAQGLFPGDCILVKGSHGVHLDRLVAAIRGQGDQLRAAG